MSTDTQVATTQETAVDVPRKAPRGFENFEMKDIILPRFRLIQTSSKSFKAGEAKAGDIQDSLTGEILGRSLELVFMGMKNGAVFFRPGEGMVCKSENGITSIKGDVCADCPFGEYHAEFKPNGEPPKCSSTKEFMAMRRDTLLTQPYPMLVSFMRTSYKAGKQLASMMRLSGEDIFARGYVLSSKTEANKKGDFESLTVKQSSKLNQEELAVAEHWFEVLKSVNVKAHEDDSFDVN